MAVHEFVGRKQNLIKPLQIIHQGINNTLGDNPNFNMFSAQI